MTDLATRSLLALGQAWHQITVASGEDYTLPCGLIQAEWEERAAPGVNLTFRGIPPRELVRFFAEVRDRGTLTVPTASAALCLEMAGTTCKVTFEQLVSVINQVRSAGLETDAYIKAMFDRVDTDQSGTLSAPELTAYLGSLGFSEAEAAAITKEADQNQDEEISLAEFQSGITPMIEAALADAPSTVRLLTVPRVAFVDDVVAWGVSRADAEAFASYLESAGSGDTCQVHPIADSDLASLLTPYLAELVGVYILPGTGVYRARSTTMEGRPGRHVHISTPAQGDMHIRYTQDGSYRYAAWTDVSTEEAPTLQFEDEAAGVVRKFWISNHQLRALETIGPWDESSEAIALLRSGRAIPAWQLAVMRDLGGLTLEKADAVSPDDMVCTCKALRRRDIQQVIDGGAASVRDVMDQTECATVCGGCETLLDDMFGNASFAQARVAGHRMLDKHIAIIELEPIGAPTAPLEAGQHVVVQGRIDGRWVTRAYSLVNSAGTPRTYDIAVKRDEMGLFSRWLHDALSAAPLLKVANPSGSYVLDRAATSHVFFAAGIGVTPALSMMRTLAAAQESTPFSLDWSVAYKTNDWLANEWDGRSNVKTHVRFTRTGGRINARDVAERYPYHEGAVAYLCGPVAYMDAVTEMLEGAGWPSAAIRTEQFTSDVSRDGDIAAAPKPKRVRTSAKGDYEEIEHTSFFVDEQPHLIREAESFLRQMYFEKGVPEAFQARWDEVRKEIDETGSYVHTVEEITYGTRVAWRNSTRCVGRYFWGSMIVRDMRHIDDERAIFDAMVEHLHLGINGGDLRAVISVFRPGDPQIRIWNPLLLIHAGYEQSDGSILGDPANAELTAKALALGWPGGSPEDRTRTAYDVLPFIVEIAGRPPQWFEWPVELRRHIHIEHPTFAWFKDLGLRWYQVPAVSGLVLDVGGIQYGCVPSNGFYITTEVGARNFGDASRYNMLPTIAEHMGIDMSHDEAHWKDRAIVELNLAVQYSFRKAGVRMLDHHTICDYFMKFHGDETAAGRETHADWDWIVPPISGSTVKPYHIEYENRILKPNYFYQKAPWSNDRWKSRA